MFKVPLYIKVEKERLLRVINYCLIFLLSFFFLWGKPAVSADISGYKSSILNSSHFSFNESFPSSHSSGKLPLKLFHTSDESEGVDENFEDDTILLIWKLSHDRLTNTTSSLRDQYFRAIQSLQNRSSVPLFILFHSWKSFLL